MRASSSEVHALRPFVIISIAYLLFTVTDGAIRMIVLLHAFTYGFSAMDVAIMFMMYEIAGVVTNLGAGLAGARWGIRCTLITGLSLQLVSYGLLFAWNDGRLFGSDPKTCTQVATIAYVTVTQMFGGIAKDLTKLGGKTVTKLVTPAEREGRLFRLVSLLTGWKNSLKGVGYFVGSALVGANYYAALAVMMGLIVIALPFAILGLPKALGASKKTVKLSDVFVSSNHNLMWLSLARAFLFASRDFWFEVPLPFFLRAPSCAGLGSAPCVTNADCNGGAACANPNATENSFGWIGGDNLTTDYFPLGVCSSTAPPAGSVCVSLNPGGGCGGVGWSRIIVGAILGGYIIVYGQMQSWTPQLVIGPLKQLPPNKLTEVLWGLINCLPTAVFAGVAWSFSENDLLQSEDTTAIAVWLMVTIGVFAIIFAINSSIHSFLVLKYAKEDKLATSVGFYYMSNAVGRLVGTLGSGVIYTYTGDDLGPYAGTDALRGMAACFIAGTVCAFIAALITFRIRDDKAGLRCGPWVCVGTREDAQEPAAAPEAPAPAAAPDTASEATDANGGSAQAHECAARAGAPLSELSGAAQLEVSEVVVVRTS